jgi:rare lipoprotein A
LAVSGSNWSLPLTAAVFVCAVAPATVAVRVRVAVPPPATAPTVETAVVAPEPAGVWLQLGAFSSAESAESFRDHATRELAWMMEPIQVQQRDGLHRVRLGPYRSRDEASAIAEKVRQSLGVAPSLTVTR